MCLLTYIPEGVQPDIAALREGARSNRDGHGFAIVLPEQRKIMIKKNMDIEKLLTEFAQARAAHPQGPALFHSRLTTDGVTGTYNNHPFHVGGDTRTVLAHNGIFTQARPGKGDIRSDTRIVADSFARKFKLRTEKGRKRFERWMGTFNKVVVLTVDPSYDRHGYILNEEKGIWDKGIWYSNSSFEPWIPRVSTWTYSGGARYNGEYGSWYRDAQGVWKWESATKASVRTGNAWLDCTVCARVFAVNPSSHRCFMCQSCQMCYEDTSDCRCWFSDGSTQTAPEIDAEAEAILDQWERERMDAVQAHAEASKELVPLGATVSDALSQAHQWARDNHNPGCTCEWCALVDVTD